MKYYGNGQEFNTYEEYLRAMTGRSMIEPRSPSQRITPATVVSQTEVRQPMDNMDMNRLRGRTIQAPTIEKANSGGLLDILGLGGKVAASSGATAGGSTGGEGKYDDFLSALSSGLLSMSGNQGLQRMGAAGFAELSESRKERKALEAATAQRNATVEALRQMKRNDLADAVESGLISGADAYKEAIKKEEKVKGIEFQGNLVNPYTGEIIAKGSGVGGGLDSKEQLSAINTLRDDLRTDLSEFNATQNAWNKISYLYQQEGGTSAYALTVAFANILDPGSVVRGEEQAAIANSGALSEGLKSQLLQALSGKGGLPQNVKDEILNIAKNQYVNKLEDARGVYQNYVTTATDYGLNPKYLYAGNMDDPAISVANLTPDALAATLAQVKLDDPTATEETIKQWWSTLSHGERQKHLESLGAK